MPKFTFSENTIDKNYLFEDNQFNVSSDSVSPTTPTSTSSITSTESSNELLSGSLENASRITPTNILTYPKYPNQIPNILMICLNLFSV